MLKTLHPGSVGCGLDSAHVGTALVMPDQAIKDLIVDEFGEKMATSAPRRLNFVDCQGEQTLINIQIDNQSCCENILYARYYDQPGGNRRFNGEMLHK